MLAAREAAMGGTPMILFGNNLTLANHPARLIAYANNMNQTEHTYFAWGHRGHGNSPGRPGDAPNMAAVLPMCQGRPLRLPLASTNYFRTIPRFWIMRRQPQAEMDHLVKTAGFEKLEEDIDPRGIFRVSIARRVMR